MRVKPNRNYTVGILLVICAILTTTAGKKTKKPKTGTKVYVLSSKYATNDPQQLLKLVLTEADLVKIAAYTQLKHTYHEPRANKVEFVRPIILSAAELLKHYSIVNDHKQLKSTYDEGIHYTVQCLEIMTSDEAKRQCYGWKAALIEAYFFCTIFAFHYQMKKSFKDAYGEAKSGATVENPELEYLNTKFDCQLKFCTNAKHAVSKKYSNLVASITPAEKNVECTQSLLRYEKDITKYESRLVEYYFLLGQSFVHDGNHDSALHYLLIARHVPVVDKKSRLLNTKVQGYIEKIKVHSPKN